MATDRTEKLIVDLVADLEPVQRVAPVSVRLARWLTVALFVAAAAVWLIGLRGNLSHAMTSPAAWVSLVFAVITCGSAAWLALRLSIPGAARSVWVRWLPATILVAWIAALVVAARGAGVAWSALLREPYHAACVIRVVAISALPTFLLTREVRRGFALDAVSAAALAALGGSTLAALAVQLVCPIDRAAHQLTSHVAPMLVLVMLAAVVARFGGVGLRPAEHR